MRLREGLDVRGAWQASGEEFGLRLFENEPRPQKAEGGFGSLHLVGCWDLGGLDFRIGDSERAEAPKVYLEFRVRQVSRPIFASLTG